MAAGRGRGEGLQGSGSAHLVRDLRGATLLLLLGAIGGEAARLTDAAVVAGTAGSGDVNSVTPVVAGAAGCVVTGRAAGVNI